MIVPVRAVMRNLRSPRGCVEYLLSPILCFMTRCYDKEEFDTDHAQGYFNMFRYFSLRLQGLAGSGTIVISVQD